MSRFPLIVLCTAAMVAPVPARAQSTATETQTQPPQSTATPASSGGAAPSIDPTKLGISFDRVRMQLTQPAPSKTKGLKIQETIEVVGKAPTPLLWDPKTAKLTSNAVPYGAPTQKDIMKLIVPKEFQTPPMDLNALMQWLMEHLNKRAE
jgi:hypothetical protein